MAKHIGIVACSAPGAALCYSTICAEAGEYLGRHAHPEISMHAYSFADHVRLLERGDWPTIGAMLAQSATKLAAIGADFAICPDNTVHQAFDHATSHSPIPWLHIADAVTAEAARIGVRRIGLLGTRYLMEGPVYPGRLAAARIECRLPGPAEREVVNGIIFGELVFGRVSRAGQDAFREIVSNLEHEQGCDAIVLGCTELPLAISNDLTGLPLLDSTRLLARAAIQRAVGNEANSPR